jgi:hypothetical protein
LAHGLRLERHERSLAFGYENYVTELIGLCNLSDHPALPKNNGDLTIS